jgi:hypothetical protein
MKNFKEIFIEMSLMEFIGDIKKKLGMKDFKSTKQEMLTLDKKYGYADAKALKKLVGKMSVEDLLNMHKLRTDKNDVHAVNVIAIELVKRTKLKEGEESDYDKFFNAKLKKWGVSSPDELSDEDRKKFFDEVDREWKADKETD